MLKSSSSRLERCYNNSSSNNSSAPTHAPGFQIDYPPPPPTKSQQPLLVAGLKVSRQVQQPLGKEVPPPLPPKIFIGVGRGGGSDDFCPGPLLCDGNKDYKDQSENIRRNEQLLLGVVGGGSGCGQQGRVVVGGSGFVLGGGSGGGKGEAVVSGTWSGGFPLEQNINIIKQQQASSLLDSHDRFKPERNTPRRQVQRMKWSSQSRWGRSLAGDLFSYNINPSSSSPFSPYQEEGSLNETDERRRRILLSQYQQLQLPPAILPVESESRVSSMTIADVSPRLGLKRVLLLYEQAQYTEAALFLRRLSVGTFRIILRELPIDIFVEAMPHSLPIIEAIYAKIYNAEGPRVVDLGVLRPEGVVLHMVKFFARMTGAGAGGGAVGGGDDGGKMHRSNPTLPTLPTLPNPTSSSSSSTNFTTGCRQILGVILLSDPTIHRKLKQRGKALDKIVEGMGQHGLVGTTDESLMPLHDALKLEFQRVVETYRGALQKLEELSLLASNKSGQKNSVAKGPAPVSSSHQRQLSLSASEIQSRLIKNKSVLNAVEPTLDNNCLDILLGILQRRIEVDKEALFQFTQLRKETGEANSSGAAADSSVVASFLMRYSRGIKQVLSLMREVGKEVGAWTAEDEDEEEEDSSDLSGYHSDSDSAIMTSGNSPFVTPRARYNFLSRSVRSKQGFRPSLLHSSWTTSSNGSSNNHSLNGGPLRPRNVKMKNHHLHLQKSGSLGKVSTTSTQSSSSSFSSSGCGSATASLLLTNSSTPSPTSSEEFSSASASQRMNAKASCTTCMDCSVTLISVPDNQVISQGVNHHRCAFKGKEGSSVEEINKLQLEIAQLKRELEVVRGSGLLRKANNSTKKEEQEGDEQKSTENKQQQNNKLLVHDYSSLYAQARVETMDALDALAELNDADELKSKLLFSVVVLAFRSVQTRLAEIKEQVSNLLQFEPNNNASSNSSTSIIPKLHDPCQTRLVEALSDYLLSSQQRFDQTRCVEHVASQLWTTLYDYPCLRKSEGLLRYITKCVDLAWRLSNQTPPCVLDYETRVFSKLLHVRFHDGSDLASESIKTYLWPALVDSESGECLHKGVVVT